MPAAVPAENGGGAPKTELQELQLKSQQVVDEVRYSNWTFWFL